MSIAKAQWVERIAAWRASGETAAQFASSQGYSAGSLRWWSSRLGRAAKARPVALARVEVPKRVAAASSGVRVDVGGARVEVDSGFDCDVLRAVVSTLRSTVAR